MRYFRLITAIISTLTILSNTASSTIFETITDKTPIYFANKVEGYLARETKFTPLYEQDGKYLVEVYIKGETKLYAWIPVSNARVIDDDDKAIHNEKVRAEPIAKSIQEQEADEARLREQGDGYAREFTSDKFSEDDLRQIADKINSGETQQRSMDNTDYENQKADISMSTFGKDIHPEGAETHSKKQDTAPSIDPSLAKPADNNPVNPTIAAHVLPFGDGLSPKVYGKGTKKMKFDTQQVITVLIIVIIAGVLFYFFITLDHKKIKSRSKKKF